jgi:serine phosphatase RsbU (regulator of sigma subunit)/anti-sigma regulatory factor (Ser/Thr protein kinase)
VAAEADALLRENAALREKILRLEADLDAMTAELAQAYDQLVPFLHDATINLESAQDLTRFLTQIMTAVDADMGGVYVMPQQGRKAVWRALPDDVVHGNAVRRVISTLNPERASSITASIRGRTGKNSKWMFTPVIANGAVVAAVGVGFNDLNRELKQSDAQVVMQMTMRVSGQLITSILQEVKERELVNQESLNIAGTIQRAIQPAAPPQVNHLEVEALWEPAAQVGGDAWGWALRPDKSLGLFMVDISGKGVPAAIASVALHTSLRTALELGLSPAQSLSFSAAQWSHTLSSSELFATAVVMVIEPESGTITSANAGHTPTLLRLKGEWQQWRATAPPIGVLDTVEPETFSARLYSGDLVVCFSDGLSEIPVGKRMWGFDDLMASITPEVRHASGALAAVQAASRAARGRKPRHDDETLFCVSYNHVPRPSAITLNASYDQLETLALFLDAVVQPCTPRVLYQVKLAVHELCINIVQHAYQGADGVIEVAVTREAEELTVRIRDYAQRGLPTPFVVREPDPLDLPEHGWGMPIVHKVMDTVSYERLADGNHWSLKKRIDA